MVMGELTSYNEQFEKIVNIIESAKERAYRKVNEELILMYRDVGEYISKQSEKTEYGDAFVQKLADFFEENYPDLKGFNRRGLYRMKQFYELYKDNEKVSTLLTQLSWSNHLKIMSACKSMEERIFYMNMCIKEKYSARELARQIDSGYYERYMLSQKPLTHAIDESKQATGNIFLDNYNDSAQKTPAVRKNVRGMNAPITNNATIIPTGFSSGIVGFSWPDVLQNAVIRCIALLFQEKHFR